MTAFLIAFGVFLASLACIGGIAYVSNTYDDYHRFRSGTRISFDQFLSFYHLAPKEWVLEKHAVGHKTKKDMVVYVSFNFRDWRKYQKFYEKKGQTEQNDKSRQILLSEVQEDIDDMRKRALKEHEKAVNEISQLVDKKIQQLGGK